MAYTKKTTEEIKTNIILNIIQNVDVINDANIGSGLDLFVTALSQELAEQYEDLDVVYNACRISTATGSDLEEIGLIVGVSRNQGASASGFTTFIRNSPAESDFNINLGTIVATQPNTGEPQLQYLTTETKTFKADIVGESATFINGIYEYKLNSRFVDSITSITSPPSTFVEGMDFNLVSYEDIIINPDNYILVNDCEDVLEWTETQEALPPTANVVEFYQGTQSINMLKSGTTSTLMAYDNVFPTTFNMGVKSLFMSLFIEDATQLAKISKVILQVSDASDFSTRFSKEFEVDDLTIGWQRLRLSRTDSNVTILGNPDYSIMKYVKIIIETTATSDTFVAGNLLMDFWFISTYENYEGDIIQWLTSGISPSDGIAFATTYKPLSLDIPVIAQRVGTQYNVSAGKINYKITSLANIDRLYNYSGLTGGLNKETDTNFRERIKSASDLTNVATTVAIQSNVQSLPFVRSCVVYDLPEETQLDEVHIYNSTTKTSTLIKEVAIETDLIISDTMSGAADYTLGVDYNLSNNQIIFTGTGAEPVNGAPIYITYNYNHIGWFNVFVVGELGDLNTSEIQITEDLINEVKAAGINFSLLQPSYINVSINIDYYLLSGYSSATVEAGIENALENYVNNLEIGQNVLLSGVIQAIMNVEGVENTIINDIGGGGATDYLIVNTEKAIIGSITITLV